MSRTSEDAHGIGNGMDALLAEAAAGRAACSLARCAEAASSLDEFADVATVARALRTAEELAAGPFVEGADISPVLERIATAHLIASDALSMLRTSIPPLRVGVTAARLMVAALRELMHVLERGAEQDGEGLEATLTVDVRNQIVTMYGECGGEPLAVLPADGQGAMVRLAGLAAASGGAARRAVNGSGAVQIGVALGVGLTTR